MTCPCTASGAKKGTPNPMLVANPRLEPNGAIRPPGNGFDRSATNVKPLLSVGVKLVFDEKPAVSTPDSPNGIV